MENIKGKNYQPLYNDLMGDIIRKYEEEGGMDNLSGKGKPLSPDYLSGDTFQHFQRIAKKAGYKPQWIKLQQEISETTRILANNYEVGMTVNIKEQLAKLNEKILKYNRLCPPPMQKGPVSLDTLKKVEIR